MPFLVNVPLVRRADLFKFFHDLFLVPWLDFTRDVPFQVNGTQLQVGFRKSVSQGVFNPA